MKTTSTWTLTELLKLNEFGTGSVDGEFTFQGTGNYGRGGSRQLVAGLNPAVQAIETQEQAEINQNIEDQAKTLGKFKRKVPPFKLADLANNDEPDMTGNFYSEQTLTGFRALPGDHFYRDLPGYPEKVNALEKKVNHVPKTQEEQEVQDYYKNQEEKFKDNLSLIKLEESIEQLIEELVEETFTSLNSSYWLANKRDHLNGYPVNTNTQSNITSTNTNLACPKNFIPDDWEHVQKTMFDDDELWGFQKQPEEEEDSNTSRN